jgi:hypothetical protein
MVLWRAKISGLGRWDITAWRTSYPKEPISGLPRGEFPLSKDCTLAVFATQSLLNLEILGEAWSKIS